MAEDVAAFSLTRLTLSRNELRFAIFGYKLDERAISWTAHTLGPVVKQPENRQFQRSTTYRPR